MSSQPSPLQNFFQALQLRHQSEQLAQQKVAEENRRKEAEGHLNLAQKQLEELHQQHQDVLDTTKQELKLKKMMQQQVMQQHFNEFIGQNPSLVPNDQKSLPSSVPTQSVSPQNTGAPAAGFSNQSPENFQLQTPQTAKIGASSGLMTPEQEEFMGGPVTVNPRAMLDQAKMAAQAKGMETSAVRGAEQPFEERTLQVKAGLQRQLEKDQNEFKASESTLERASKEKIASLERQAQISIANGANATRMMLGHMEYDIPQSQLESGIYSAATGQRTFNTDNRFDRAVLTGAQLSGIRPLAPKNAEALQNLQSLSTTFKNLNDFVNTYLPDEKTQGSALAKGEAFIKGKITGTGLPTDALNKLNEIKTGAIDIGRSLEAMTGGRVLATQLGLDLNGLASPGITKQQGQELINNLQNRYVTREQDVLMGGMGDPQKKMIYKAYGLKPGWLRFAPQKNKIGQSLDEEESINRGHPAYK